MLLQDWAGSHGRSVGLFSHALLWCSSKMIQSVISFGYFFFFRKYWCFFSLLKHLYSKSSHSCWSKCLTELVNFTHDGSIDSTNAILRFDNVLTVTYRLYYIYILHTKWKINVGQIYIFPPNEKWGVDFKKLKGL